MRVKEVTSEFGHFIKYRSVKAAAQAQDEVQQSVSRFAFNVLMSAQRQMQSLNIEYHFKSGFACFKIFNMVMSQ